MEKKIDNKIEDNRGNIILENRKKMTLTGVEEVISFDDEKIRCIDNKGFKFKNE